MNRLFLTIGFFWLAGIDCLVFFGHPTFREGEYGMMLMTLCMGTAIGLGAIGCLWAAVADMDF